MVNESDVCTKMIQVPTAYCKTPTSQNSLFEPHLDVKQKEDMPQFPLRSFDGTRLLMERIPL
jgi:hypothetical protein